MTLAELDAQLEHWRGLADTALNNTMEVYENPIYQALCHGTFKGETAGKLGVPGKIDQLLQQASYLKNFVDRILEIRQGITMLNRSERIAEIQALFTTDAITLGDEQTPLANRTLTGAAAVTRKCTPKELLDTLTVGFDIAITLVSEIDAIQTTVLMKLDEAGKELDKLRSKQPSSSTCAAAQKKLEGLESLIATDPIGLQRILNGEVLPMLRAVKDASDAEEQQRVKLKADMAIAEILVGELQTAHLEAVAQASERKKKLTTGVRVRDALADEEIQATEAWLFTLQKAAASSEWKCVPLGLQKWISRVREHIAAERESVSENRNLVEKRLELRGLLGALQAKVAGEGRAEEPHISEVGEKARKLLYQRPTPLEEAEALVREYEKLSR